MKSAPPSPTSKIAILDSGIGGTTTLREIRKILPNENFLYFGDSKNCPYGEKSDNELLKISQENINRILNEDIKLIVVACNTLTTRILPKLREKFKKIKFVGTEPALKPAIKSSARKIAVLSTPATAKSLEEKITFLPKESSKEILNIACPGLAAAIESRDDIKIESTLSGILCKIDEETRSSIELVVLGCTHYPIIKDKIKRFFPEATFIDGNSGVAMRVRDILSQSSLLNGTEIPGLVEYIWT